MQYALSDYEGKDTARIIEPDKNVTGEGQHFSTSLVLDFNRKF